MEHHNTTNWINDLNGNAAGVYSPANFNFNNILQHQNSLPEFADNSANNMEEENDYQKNGKTRSRIPREVLDILLQEFQVNNSPNTADRKRIAAQCNIEEKRVRIWFQNKRAKLKRLQNNIQNQEGNSRNDQYQEENQVGHFNTHIFEDEFELEPLFDNVPWGLNSNYYFIDSSSVSVGSWRRLKNGHLSNEDGNEQNNSNTSNVMDLVTNLSNLSPKSIDSIMGDSTDLLLIISQKNNEINYFFSAIADEKRILFRVFYPIYTVVNCSISVNRETHGKKTSEVDKASYSPNTHKNDDDNDEEDEEEEEDEELCRLSLMLNKPPKFAVYFADNDEGNDNQWNMCEDFSEDKQVSTSFIGSYEIPHIVTGLEDSLKKMNSLILEYNSKFGGIYHVPQPVMQYSQENASLKSENNIATPKMGNGNNLPLGDSLLKKNFATSFPGADFGFSPTPSNGAQFFQMSTTSSFLNGHNNFTENNHNHAFPYMENPLVNNQAAINRAPSNHTSELLNVNYLTTGLENQNIGAVNTANNEALLNINSSLIEDDEMKNDLYINSMLDLN